MRIWKIGRFLVVGLLVGNVGLAQTAPPLKPMLQGLGFLVGHWSTPTRGKVADTGGSSSGSISFEPAVGGAVLLRRDHVELFDAAGKHSGDFDILMMIYPEAGQVRAEYSDGDHVIHYTSSVVDPGRSVVFDSGAGGCTAFRLSFVLKGTDRLGIAFSMAPPGGGAFRAIATGEATRDR